MSSDKELIGFEFVDEDGNECFVAQADPDLGITIKTLDGELAYCLNKAQFHLPNKSIPKAYYLAAYNELKNKILAGGKDLDVRFDYNEEVLKPTNLANIFRLPFTCSFE